MTVAPVWFRSATGRCAETRKPRQLFCAGRGRNRYLRYRIRAIDAATFEIGCRPETFATEFRYLRSDPPWSLDNTKPWFIEKGPTGCMQVTYHAGEDFLDLADGMRAIDEAICYLNLQRGDRIGHALALGVAPELHYKFKENQIWLPGKTCWIT